MPVQVPTRATESRASAPGGIERARSDMWEPPRLGKQRGRLWRIAATVALLVLAIWSLGAWLGQETGESAEITARAARGDLDVDVRERGDLESSETITVRCEVEGEQIKITEIVPEGTRVTKDQVVIRFDTEKLSRSYAEQEVKWRTAESKGKAASEDLEVAKNKAASEIAKAKLAVKLAEIDLRKYREGEYVQEKRNIDGEILLAEEELRRAKERLEYSERLNKKGYVSISEVEADRVAVTKATNTLNVAREKLRVLEDFTRERKEAELTSNAAETARELERTERSQASAVAKAESDLEGARATAAVEKALLGKLEQQLDRCVVKAPADGIVVYDKSRPWDNSSRIQPGGVVHSQRVLFSLPDLAQMQVKVKIHESSVKKVRAGQEAQIRLDAQPNLVLHGVVEKVATLAEDRGFWDQRGVKEFETVVKIRDLPEDAGIKPGMTAEVRIHVAHISDVLLVPIQSVAEQDGRHYAFIVTPESVAQREVAIGENNDSFVEIKSGLDDGDQVTLDARTRLAASVRPTHGTKAEPPANSSSGDTAAPPSNSAPQS